MLPLLHVGASHIMPPPYAATDPSLLKPCTPNPPLVLHAPPPLDPGWLAHEETLNRNPEPAITDPKARQKSYSERCKDLNAHLLSGRDEHLNHGITVFDTFINTRMDTGSYSIDGDAGLGGHKIPIRSYNPSSSAGGPPPKLRSSNCADKEEGKDIVIYYHGGGLCVGDLDSEDLSCRRISKALGCTVYSVDYRLMPDFTADDSVFDAMRALIEISTTRKARRLIVLGSSSGGQLAAMIAQSYIRYRGSQGITLLHGVCLRGPVLCDASDGGKNLPKRFRPWHTSMRPEFHTSLLSVAALNASNRTQECLPLEADEFSKLPRHWIQVCTNDIYYSDGMLYAEALRQAGVDVKLDIVRGWPHTFWLKAPELERAVQADAYMIEGLRWLLESEVEDKQKGNGRQVEEQRGGFVPFSDEEFERKFMGL